MLYLLRIKATFFTGSLVAVAWLVLFDKALTPLPPRERECHPADRRLAAENEGLRSEVGRLRVRVAEVEADYLAARCRNEQLMRLAVFPPARGVIQVGGELPAADLIPPQRLPVLPEDRDAHRE